MASIEAPKEEQNTATICFKASDGFKDKLKELAYGNMMDKSKYLRRLIEIDEQHNVVEQYS